MIIHMIHMIHRYAIIENNIQNLDAYDSVSLQFDISLAHTAILRTGKVIVLDFPAL